MSDDTVRGLVAVREVLTEMRERQVAGAFKSLTLNNWADRIEQALAQPAASEVGEPVAHRFQGSCPDELQPTARDPLCAACTPPAPAAGDGLPELPVSYGEHCVSDSVRTMREPGYTADQMRAIRDAGIAYGRQLGRDGK